MDVEELDLEPIKRLKRDVARAYRDLRPNDCRYLVDTYYQVQVARIQAGNRLIAARKAGEPCSMLEWVWKNLQTIEESILAVLDEFTATKAISIWARSITGIGPVLAAGLFAEIDIKKAPYPGNIWRLAGLEPTVVWLGREGAANLIRDVVPDGKKVLTADDMQAIVARAREKYGAVIKIERLMKRCAGSAEDGFALEVVEKELAKKPWNERLKVLCFKIGASFIRQVHRESDFYSKLYHAYKADQIARNEAGEFREQALIRAKQVSPSTEAYRYYKQGKLPPGHIHMRALRWVVKLFLSHYHAVLYELTYGKKPPPAYVFRLPGHDKMIEPPNWPLPPRARI